MPASRVRQHIASTHTSLTPQMVGNALDSTIQSRNQKYAALVNRKRTALVNAKNRPNDDLVGIASVEVDDDSTSEKQSTLASEVSLYGTWINDIASIELKHLLIFNNDNTGSLKSQGNVDGLGARRVNFTYHLAEDLNSIKMQYVPISPLETNPFEIAKYVSLQPETIKTTFTFQLKVFESTEGFTFIAPSGKNYEPFLALEFDASPWPENLFPSRVRYYGILKRIPLMKKMKTVIAQ